MKQDNPVEYHEAVTPAQLPAIIETRSPVLEETEAGNEDPCLPLARSLASWFVRREGRYYDVNKPNTSLSKDDVERISIYRLSKCFPQVQRTAAIIKSAFQRALVAKHADQDTSVPVWDGRQVCRPDIDSRTITQDGLVSINTFSVPAYRKLGVTDATTRPLDLLLERTMAHEVDRADFKNWMAWCLQNEADKPNYAQFLFSRQKGTGKSTIAELCSRLFGQENSIVQNSVGQLTGRFNKTILGKKFVVLEEMKLKPGTPASNAIKTFITEKVTATEAKGREMEPMEQCCCFLFTSNYFPSWIESGERRYRLVQCGNPKYCTGKGLPQFRDFIGRFKGYMENEELLAGIYNGLMQHELPADYNPKVFDPALVDTPAMKRLVAQSDQVQLDELRELLDQDSRKAISHTELAKLAGESLGIKSTQLPHLLGELGWTKTKAKWSGATFSRPVYVAPDCRVDQGQVHLPDGTSVPIGDQKAGGMEEFELIEAPLKPGDRD